VNVTTPYPPEITAPILATYARIADAEIERDIAETERELEAQRRIADAQLVVAKASTPPLHEARLAQFRADNAAYNISQLKALLAFLHRLLKARRATVAA